MEQPPTDPPSSRRRRLGHFVWLITIVTALGISSCFAGRAIVRGYVYARLLPRALPAVAVPEGLEELSAESCGACHQAIYAEWRESAMARSYSSAVFRADWRHHDHFYFCLNCHAPLENQQPLSVTGLASLDPVEPEGVVNPAFDELLRREGVTCIVCHIHEGRFLGRHEPVDSPHEVVVSQRLGSAEACGHCHQFPAPPGSDVRRPPSDTVGEWRRWMKITGRADSCIECHMPAVTRPVIPDGRPLVGRRHTWPGVRDPEFLRTGLEIRDARRGDDGILLHVVNLAGHNNPTGEPARAIEIRVTLLDSADRPVGEQQYWIQRRIDVVEMKEFLDNTLLPDETRRLHFEFEEPDLAVATSAVVEVAMHRLHNLREAASAAGVDVPDQRVAFLTSTIRW